MSSFKNLNHIHLTQEETTEIHDLIAELEERLSGKLINLSAEERRKYGSVNEQNKLFINKVYDFYISQKKLCSPDVNWEEFESDYQSRKRLESIINHLETLVFGLSNTKILHDHDNYQASLDDYAYTNYKIGTSSTGFENKHNELKQFFNRTKDTERKKINEPVRRIDVYNETDES